MSAGLIEIAAAVTEAQAVVELVAQRLGTGAPLTDDQMFQLNAALQVALRRLDGVHQSVFLSTADGAAARGVVQ